MNKFLMIRKRIWRTSWLNFWKNSQERFDDFPEEFMKESLKHLELLNQILDDFLEESPNEKFMNILNTHMCSKKLNIHDILSFQERFPRRFQDKKSGKKCRSLWWHFLEYLWKDLLKEDFSEISGGMPGLICGGDLNKITERKIGKK